MSRTFTVPAGSSKTFPITIVQRQALKTSDGLYWYDSDGDLMYVKVSNDALLLLNNIYPAPEDSRSVTPDLESRSYSDQDRYT